MLGVWPGGRGVGGDDVVDRRVPRAGFAAGAGVLEVNIAGEVAGDGDGRGVGAVPVGELVEAAGVGRVGEDEAHAGAPGGMPGRSRLCVLWGRAAPVGGLLRGSAGLGSDVSECLGPAGVGDRDLMPEPGEPGGERGAHVPGTDDRDPHRVLLVLHEGVSACAGVRGRSQGSARRRTRTRVGTGRVLTGGTQPGAAVGPRAVWESRRSHLSARCGGRAAAGNRAEPAWRCRAS